MFDFKSFSHCLRLVPSFLRLARHAPDARSPFFHDWGRLADQTVLREEFLPALCKGKRVLHFGFVDAPFSEERIKKGLLLHQQIQKAAEFLYGLDIDAASLEVYRKLTSDHQNSILDITAPLPEAGFLAQRYDLILFPEVLEHLLRPADAMANLRRICQLNPGARLCVTTPNAYSVMGFFTALSGNELVHPDHYFYFSPATLTKLLRDTGFTDIELSLYTSQALRGSPGITKHGLIALCSPGGDGAAPAQATSLRSNAS